MPGRGITPGAGPLGIEVAVAVVLALVGPEPRALADEPTRPNVVVIMTDDQTVESLRVMPRVLAGLAAEGTTFANSFAAYPLCAPSRATLNTGQYAHNHGVLGNRPPDGGYGRLDASNTLPVWLAEAGYRTVHVGKYLNGYGRDVPADVPPGWSEWYGSIDGSTYLMWGYTLNENGTPRTYGQVEVEDPALYQTDVYARKAVELIERLAPAAAPFYLDLAFLAPHAEGGQAPGPSVRSAPRHRGLLADEALPPEPSFNERDVSDKPLFLRESLLLAGPDVRRVRARYRARLESLLAVDEAVGVVLEALAGSGELENTWVVFTSDNGFFHGEHRVANGKLLAYEPSARVPLIVRGPGVPAGAVSEELVANVDLAATIVEVAGATAGRALDGRSLIPYARDPARRSGRPILLETRQDTGDDDGPPDPAPAGGRTYQAVRTERYLWAEYASGDRELYDLARDPHQAASLHADPGYAGTRAALEGLLEGLARCRGEGCRAEAGAIPGPDPAVVPVVPADHWQFEGFDVVSHVPATPAGLVFVFHGSNGSAAFADKVETVETLNTLVRRGWGFVATESGERTPPRRWDVGDASLGTNPDLARLARLHRHLVDTTDLGERSPLAALGMSQGARFASLFGHAFRAAAYPVAAVAMSMGEVARPVLDAGGVRVPTVFVVAENDAPGTNAAIRAEQAAAAAAGVPTALHEARETRLAPDRFRRIPEIDDRTARLLFDTFVAAGIWNAAGERLVPVAEAVARAEAVLLPAPVGGLRADILDQVRAVLAVHQYTGAFSREVGDFADLHLPAPSCADALLARDEQCDDGNLRDGDCCGAGCQVEAAGTVCRPAAGPCDIAEACDGEAPACPGDGRHPDTDLDGVCDPADVCTNAAGQRDFVVVGRLPKPRLVARRVNTDPRAGNETLSLAGVFRLPDGAGFPALDPAASGARVRVESAAARVLLDVVLPGGARQGRGRGWTRAHTGRRWTWVDPGGTVPGGVRRLRITDRGRTRPGHVAVEMVARRSTLSVVAGDEPLAVAVALGDRASGSTGLCGESRFGAGECRFGRNGRTLRCRR